MLSACQIEALVDTSILKKNSSKSELVWRRYDRYKIENTKIKRSNQKPTRVNRVIDDIIRATKPAEPSRQVSQVVQAKPPPHHRHLIHSLLATCATSAPHRPLSELLPRPLSRTASEMHSPSTAIGLREWDALAALSASKWIWSPFGRISPTNLH